MSRIWQALKQAERERAREGGTDTELESEAERECSEQANATKNSERRQGLRHSHKTLILVYGSDCNKQPFHEECETVDANENGCLFTLESPVARGQRLFLTNMRNQAEQECRVVYVGRKIRGKVRVGVEFFKATPEFWRMG